MAIPFDLKFQAPYGELEAVAPRIRRLLAPNPGPFTFRGTGVFIVGRDTVAIIDPGPDDPEHLAALKTALAHATVTHILVTHTHRDHSPAARAVKAWSGARIFGFGPPGANPSQSVVPIEEANDAAFVPDVLVRDGDIIEGDGFAFECVHTPGHTSNHMCYALKQERALFTGDHVMGWSTSVVAPPDGDMGDYLDSLRKLLSRDDATYWPTHGGPIRDPKPFVQAYLDHRLMREAQILAAIADGVTAIADMVRRLYPGLDERLFAAANLSVLAHAIDLTRRGVIAPQDGSPGPGATYRLIR